MMKKTTIIIALFTCAFFNNVIIAQEAIAQEAIVVDASKPTNLYTQVNTMFEYQNYKKGDDRYGARINIQYIFNPDNLLWIELPLLYNSGTEKFGLSDMRVRYFHVAKRNISETIIAIAPFVDFLLPTGKFEDGLGSSFWTLSGGVVVGIVLTKKIALFPGIGYVHITEPKDYPGKAQNGINLQTNMSIRFTDKVFLFVNPIVTIFEKPLWSGEFNLNYMAKPKLKFNVGYFPLFTQEVHTLRVGATFFL